MSSFWIFALTIYDSSLSDLQTMSSIPLHPPYLVYYLLLLGYCFNFVRFLILYNYLQFFNIPRLYIIFASFYDPSLLFQRNPSQTLPVSVPRDLYHVIMSIPHSTRQSTTPAKQSLMLGCGKGQ